MPMPTNARPRRDARNSRLDEWLSPLDSQAAMDAAQGSDVGPSWSSGAKGGGALASAVGSVASPSTAGGGGRTQASTVSQRQNCAGGQCNVSSSRATTATTTPAPRIPAARVGADGKPTPESLRANAREIEETALGVAGTNPEFANPGLGVARERRLTATEQEATEFRDRKYADDTERANRVAAQVISESEAATKASLSEAGLSDQQAQLTREATGLGNAESATELLTTAIASGMSPTDYAAARERLDRNTVNLPNTPAESGGEGKPTVGRPQQVIGPAVSEEKRTEYMRQGFAAHGINMLVASEEWSEMSQAIPSKGEMRYALGKDSETGQPIETKEGGSKEPKMTGEMKRYRDAVQRSADAIVAGFEQTGVFKSQEWAKIDTAINNNVDAPLRRFARQQALERDAQRINALPEEYRDAARAATIGRADQRVDGVVRVVRDRAAAAAGRIGGATPNEPSRGEPERGAYRPYVGME